MNGEPTIICPKCKTEIKLTESLAAPLIESTRRDHETRLARKDTDMAKIEEQTDRVLQATVGMYGDPQGIAGKTLQEIEELEMKALERHT